MFHLIRQQYDQNKHVETTFKYDKTNVNKNDKHFSYI
jgi:hypothetical protein